MYTSVKRYKLSRAELEQLLKDNKLRGFSLNRPEIAKILIDKGILKHEDIFNEVQQKTKKDLDEKYKKQFTKKKMKVTDITTGDVYEFPTLYRARKEMKIFFRPYLLKDGVLYKERYKIEVE